MTVKVKSEFKGFNLIEMTRVGERCFVLGRHKVISDAYVVWEWGTDFADNASHYLSERRAIIELQSRVEHAKVIQRKSRKVGG